jgi:CubicO group peptidase (beta-lactamase class C family)
MDIDAKKPMTKDALFRLASNSKPVTAAAVMILFEEGKLRLTDPVSKFIPEFRDAKVAVAYEHPPTPTSASASPYYTVPATRDITILDLLTHTSGLASGGPTNTDYQKIMRSRKPTDTLADIIPQLGALPLDFQPGSQWHYSPTGGFDTLGRIVEIASGMSFDRFLRERLFEPLDMRDTGFNVPESDAARLVTIYRRTETGLEKGRNSSGIANHSYFSGAAGLTSTAEDYYKFFQMLCNGGILNGKRILSPWTVDLMFSNQVGDLFGGKMGRAPRGVGFGLGGEVVVSVVDSHMRKPNGSYGWGGAFGTYCWANRKEQMVAVYFVQTPGPTQQSDFDNAVAQAVIE